MSSGISGDFKQFLLDTATNNETSFFRDPKVFQVIEKHILPSLKTNQPQTFSYRIWSAASSFGQEPYSLAMLAHEFMTLNPNHPRFQIFGTDISDNALKRCRAGQYSQLEVQRGLSANRLVQYFKKDEAQNWHIQAPVKSLVEFKNLNLLSSFAQLGTFNIILCRYVLIYQDAVKKKAIVQKLEKCLAPNGILIMGASESGLGLITDMDQVAVDGAIFYKKRAVVPVSKSS